MATRVERSRSWAMAAPDITCWNSRRLRGTEYRLSPSSEMTRDGAPNGTCKSLDTGPPVRSKPILQPHAMIRLQQGWARWVSMLRTLKVSVELCEGRSHPENRHVSMWRSNRSAVLPLRHNLRLPRSAAPVV